jgi:hypothetical protein
VIVKLELDEASAKVRSGGPVDQDEDRSLPVWAGEIPLRTRALTPVSESDAATPPGYAERYTRLGW